MSMSACLLHGARVIPGSPAVADSTTTVTTTITGTSRSGSL
jgi:hypothetical protein